MSKMSIRAYFVSEGSGLALATEKVLTALLSPGRQVESETRESTAIKQRSVPLFVLQPRRRLAEENSVPAIAGDKLVEHALIVRIWDQAVEHTVRAAIFRMTELASATSRGGGPSTLPFSKTSLSISMYFATTGTRITLAPDFTMFAARPFHCRGSS
jgi:hypothetical protein